MGEGGPSTPLTSRPRDLCNDVFPRSKKSQNHKKPSNSTKSPPSSATIHPHLNITNPTTAKHQPTPSTGTTRAPAKPPPLTPDRQVAQSAEASTHILGQAGRRERETLSSGWGRERSTPGPGVFLSSLDPDLQRPGRNLSTHGPL